MHRLTLFGSPCLRLCIMFHILIIFNDKLQSFLDICIQYYRNSILQSMILAVTQACCKCKLELFQLFSGLLLKLCQTHRPTSWLVEPGQSNLVGRTRSVELGLTMEVSRAQQMRSACAHPARTTAYHVRAPTRLDQPGWTNQVGPTRFDEPGSTNQVRPIRFDQPGSTILAEAVVVWPGHARSKCFQSAHISCARNCSHSFYNCKLELFNLICVFYNCEL